MTEENAENKPLHGDWESIRIAEVRTRKPEEKANYHDTRCFGSTVDMYYYIARLDYCKAPRYNDDIVDLLKALYTPTSELKRAR